MSDELKHTNRELGDLLCRRAFLGRTALGLGGFAELRGVNVSTEGSGNFRFLTATLGIRL